VVLSYSTGEVIEVIWYSKGLEGTVDVQLLPFTVEKLYLGTNQLTGTIDWTSLPEELRELTLSSN
jgi:hypothetical protein